MADQQLTVDRDGDVATITLQRERAANSLSRGLVADLGDACVDLAADRDVRCIALTGAGPMFCTGADLDDLAGDETDEPRLRQLAAGFHVAVRSLLLAPKPVVVGVNGVAAGGGCSLALCGDVVLVADDARFEFAYPRIGLSGDGGATFLLPRLLGLRQAKEFVLRDAPVSPARAVDLGLASEVVASEDLTDRLDEEAADLAAGPTRAYGVTKRLLTEGVSRGLGGQLEAEAHAISRLATSDDYTRGLDAFRDGDDPTFFGR